MPNKLTLLIIEDEVAIRSGLTDLFVYHGYAVDAVADGREGLDKALAGGEYWQTPWPGHGRETA